MAPFIIPVALVAGGYAVGRGIEAGVKALYNFYYVPAPTTAEGTATPATETPAASPTEPSADAPAEAAPTSAANEENASAEAVAQEIQDLGRGLEELEAEFAAAQASSAVHAWFLAGKALRAAALPALGDAWVAYREAYNTCLTFGLSEDTLTAITEDFRENEEYLGGFIQAHFADCAEGVGCAERGDLSAGELDSVRRHTACLEECMRRMSAPADKLARVSALVARLDAVVAAPAASARTPLDETRDAYVAATTAAYQYVATATARLSATQRKHAEGLLETLDAAEQAFCEAGGDDAVAMTKGADARRLLTKRISMARKG